MTLKKKSFEKTLRNYDYFAIFSSYSHFTKLRRTLQLVWQKHLSSKYSALKIYYCELKLLSKPQHLFQFITINNPSCMFFSIPPPSSNDSYELRKERRFAQPIWEIFHYSDLERSSLFRSRYLSLGRYAERGRWLTHAWGTTVS